MTDTSLRTSIFNNGIVLDALKSLPLKVRKFEIDLVAGGIPRPRRQTHEEFSRYTNLCAEKKVIPYSQVSFSWNLNGTFFPGNLTFGFGTIGDNHRIALSLASDAIIRGGKPHLISFSGDGSDYDHFVHSKVESLVDERYELNDGNVGLVKVASRYQESDDAFLRFGRGYWGGFEGLEFAPNRLKGDERAMAEAWFRELIQDRKLVSA